MAIREFLSGLGRGTKTPDAFAASKADELKPSRYLSAIHEAIDKAFKDGRVLTCSDPSRGFMNAFEVGLYGNLAPDVKVERIKSLQAKMRKVLGEDPGVPGDGMLNETTRKMMDNAREKLNISGPPGQIDYTLYKKLEDVRL
jgi:hypothetical protein